MESRGEDMFCIFCGYQFQDTSLKNCPKCGKEIYHSDPVPAQDIKEDIIFFSGSEAMRKKIPHHSPTMRKNTNFKDTNHYDNNSNNYEGYNKDKKEKRINGKESSGMVVLFMAVLAVAVIGISRFDMNHKIMELGSISNKVSTKNGFSVVQKLDKDYNCNQFFFTTNNDLYCFQRAGASVSKIVPSEEKLEKIELEYPSTEQPVAVKSSIFFTAQTNETGGNLYVYDENTNDIKTVEAVGFECIGISTDGKFLYAFGRDDANGFHLLKIDPKSLEGDVIGLPEEVINDYESGYLIHGNKMYYIYNLEYSDEQGIPERGIKSYDFESNTVQYEEMFGEATDIFENSDYFCYCDRNKETVYLLPHDGSEKITITDIPVSRVVLAQQYVYIVDDENSKVYRAKTDGTNLQEIPLPEGSVFGDVVSGDWFSIIENNQVAACHIEEKAITEIIHNVFEIMQGKAVFEMTDIPLIDMR